MSGADSLMVMVGVALAPLVLATGSWLVVVHLERLRNRRRLLTGLRAVVRRPVVFPAYLAVAAMCVPIGLMLGLMAPTTALWAGGLALAVGAAGSALLGGGRIAIDPNELDLELRTLLDEAA
ncbi:MAG: hypothetical protein ACFCVC_02190 [Acidimicrobiia bacterium]